MQGCKTLSGCELLEVTLGQDSLTLPCSFQAESALPGRLAQRTVSGCVVWSACLSAFDRATCQPAYQVALRQ